MSDAGSGYTFGDPTPTASPTATPAPTPSPTGTAPTSDAALYVEMDAAGNLTFVRMTPEQLQAAVASGRKLYEPTAQQVLDGMRTGQLNPMELPDEVRAELGRMAHADPSLMTGNQPGYQTVAGASPFTSAPSLGAGSDTGFHIDPYVGAATVDPVIRDATSLYYDLYGVSPPQGFIESLQTKFGNIYDIKAALMKQAERDGAPGFAATRYGTAIDAANRYYFELYGVPPPTGMIESMFEGGQSLFKVQHQLLTGAKQAGAPGYADVRFTQEVGAGEQLYFSLWGRDAPPRYIENHINNGLNLWEIEKMERSKPAFMQTKVAKDEMYAAAEQLTSFLGMGY